MLAYLVPTENRFVRTQGEARKLGFGEATEIPTDKNGLLNFVNEMLSEHARQLREAKGDTAYVDDAPPHSVAEANPVHDTPEPPKPSEKPAERDFGATAVLSRMDNPKLDIDAVIEHIAKMKGGHALKRVAGAVSMRFEELSK